MPPKTTKTSILDMAPGDSFILSDNPKTGVILREVESDARGSGSGQSSDLTESQLVCSALNEAARKYGEGKFFWIPSRKARAYAKDHGLCRSGGDIVMIPWMWTTADKYIWDEATPYERLRLTNAWTCLPGKTIVICIYVQHKVKPNSFTPFPFAANSFGQPLVKYQFGTVSVLLLWDDFPNMAFKEHFKGPNLDGAAPTVGVANRRAHRIHSMKAVIQWLMKAWSHQSRDGRYSKRVSMEEVYADALTPGPRKDETLSKITWRRT